MLTREFVVNKKLEAEKKNRPPQKQNNRSRKCKTLAISKEINGGGPQFGGVQVPA